MTRNFNIGLITQHYMIAALWSSIGDDGEPLDDNHGIEDIAPETAKEMGQDVADFVASNADLLEQSGLSDEQIGHDFWLTRCGHGAGFWDRGLGDIGDKLSDAARVYGDVYLYIGDDGKVYS